VAGFSGPRRKQTKTQSAGVAPAPIQVPIKAAIPKASRVAYYDPSRIIKDIKVVKDLRQSGTERGETQSGDSGTLGPGSIVPPVTKTPAAPKAPGNNLLPLALAVGAFFLFGG